MPKLGDLGDHGGPVQTVPLRVDSPALDAGSNELAVTRLGCSTSGGLRRASGEWPKRLPPIRMGAVSTSAPVTTNAYDANGNLVSVTDPLGSVTAYAYDNLGRETSETDAEEGVTEYSYDASGRMTSLTDTGGEYHLLELRFPGPGGDGDDQRQLDGPCADVLL